MNYGTIVVLITYYLCDKEFVICFNTPLLFFFNYDNWINRMGIANSECYIESDINSFFYVMTL